MHKKIAIIPARSGSKGLPNKNILMLLDKPLIAYTIEAAINSGIFERVLVSTDSLEYKQISEQYGAEVIMRSDALASDTATSFMVIEDVLHKVSDFDYFVLLQPTSPFRTEVHIKTAVDLFENSEYADFLVSVAESGKNADLIKPITDDLSLKAFDQDFSHYRRQNAKEYTPNGAIFIGYNEKYLEKKHFFGADSIAYLMNKIDSVDIDDQLDFELAISIQTKKKKQKILLNMIQQRIDEKKAQMNLALSITLIGHSIFDYWNIERLNGQKVNNLGVAGISTKGYLDLVLEKRLITTLGDKVVLFLGSNDIVLDKWEPKLTLKWIHGVIEKLKIINHQVNIYVLSVPLVRGRMERSNISINALNQLLKKELLGVTFVELSSAFCDDFGSLPADFTHDGLHFTTQAYQQLEKELSDGLR